MGSCRGEESDRCQHESCTWTTTTILAVHARIPQKVVEIGMFYAPPLTLQRPRQTCPPRPRSVYIVTPQNSKQAHRTSRYRHDDGCLIYDEQAQVVLAFEQSLTNMTQRLQHLALSANKKVGK